MRRHGSNDSFWVEPRVSKGTKDKVIAESKIKLKHGGYSVWMLF